MLERNGLSSLLADLADEGEYLEALVSRPEVSLRAPTPAAGWTVAHQIGHLHWSDLVSIQAITDPVAFAATAELFQQDPGLIDRTAGELAERAPVGLLAAWRADRARLISLLEQVPHGTRIPWFGPPMGAGSMATARIMETWAHGVDISDTLGLSPAATTRLHHVADLGVRTRRFAYSVHGQSAPEDPVRVELAGPGGQIWVWGPEGSRDLVRGPALDFCLLVTRRRHPADLDLVLTGSAVGWAQIAQAYAGPPGAGRGPTRRVR